jgi:membrane protease YdiL (CAAX protease family)
MTTEPRRALAATWIGLVIALILPPILSYLLPTRLEFVTKTLVKEGIFWTCAAAVVLIAVRWERRPLGSIGLRKPTWTSLLLGIAGFIVLSVAYGLVTLLQQAVKMPETAQPVSTLLVLPVWLRSLLVLRAGVVEEILYRGYPIERIGWLSGSRLLGAIVPLVVFSLMHVPFWGVAHLPVVVVAAAVLTVLYMWKRDLTVNMIAHLLTDLVGVIVVPLMYTPQLP